MKEELQKRIDILRNKIIDKRNIVETELQQIEQMCVELIGLSDRINKLNEQANSD